MSLRWLACLLVVGCHFDGGGLGFDDGTPPAPIDPGAAVPEDVRPVASCAELAPGSPSGVYPLAPDDGGPPFAAYCHMNVGGGGWTLVLKADGNAPTFAYDSAVWTTAEPLAADAPDLDDTEAKLDSYTRVAVHEVLIELTDFTSGELHRVVLTADAPSLMALVIAPTPVVTGSRRQVWLDALPGSVLQEECTLEGFNLANAWTQVRIGVVANNESFECDSFDSRLGVGGGGCPTCTHCGVGPGMNGPAVGNNDRGCSTLPAFAAVFVR